MNILFVEDDDLKANTILDFISEEEKFQYFTFERKLSWQSGLMEIIKNYKVYDMLLLDMSMPRYDSHIGDVNEEFETFAGWDILKEMNRRKLEIPTCVVTSFDLFEEGNDVIDNKSLDGILRGEFPEIYLGMIYFDSSQILWKNELTKILNTED